MSKPERAALRAVFLDALAAYYGGEWALGHRHPISDSPHSYQERVELLNDGVHVATFGWWRRHWALTGWAIEARWVGATMAEDFMANGHEAPWHTPVELPEEW